MIGTRGAADSDTAVNHFPTWPLAVGDPVLEVIDLAISSGLTYRIPESVKRIRIHDLLLLLCL